MSSIDVNNYARLTGSRRFWRCGCAFAIALALASSALAEDAAPSAEPTPPIPPNAIATPAPAATPTVGATPDAAVGAPAPIPTLAAVQVKRKRHIVAPRPGETALSDDPVPTFQPDTATFTTKAAERYAAIVDAGGWPIDIVALGPAAKGDAVVELRKRLAIEGDLSADAGAPSPEWDAWLTAAVKHFQARMGLKQTGIVAGATLKALNVPASVRARELAASAQRLTDANFAFGERYVVVNLPSASVEAVENGQVAHHYRAIVGGVEHPSPEIQAHIQVVNLNPTWTVPTSIIKKEIIPHMRRDPSYLSRAKIRMLDASGAEVDPRSIDWNGERAANYTLRQDSGAGNSLGAIRIGMPNKLAVYMHDTPGKALFGADYRFLSHGCVRVQGVYDYAQWILEGTPGGWDKNALLTQVKTGLRIDIRVARPIPVVWIYLTGWSNADGEASFRDDVYGLDTPAETAAAAPATPEKTQ